jgi:hypothetical protein
LSTVIPPGSNWQLGAATDINGAGEITGWGTAPNGQIHAFLLRPSGSAAVGEPARLAAVPALRVWPNPASGAAAVGLDLPVATPASVTIFDAAGNLIRHLHSGSLPSGTTEWQWSRSDDAGRAVPAGVYFVRASAGPGRASTKIVLR